MQTPTGRTMVAAAVVGVLAVPLGLGLMGAATLSASTSTAAGSGAAAAEQTCVDTTSNAGAGTFDATQRANASAILAVVKGATQLGDEAAQRRAGVISLAVAIQESSLRNLDGGDRDSVGLFQQRPSQGWGSVANLQNVSYATTAFLGINPKVSNGGLVDVVGWQTGDLAAVAQAVQRSADGSLYAGREAAAHALVDELWDSVTAATDVPDTGGGTATPVTAPAETEDCGDDDASEGSGGVDDGGWGDHENGRIPLRELCPITWAPGQMLKCSARDDLAAMNAAYRTEFGTDIAITDSYRDYAGQVAAKAAWCAKGACQMAAEPGTSNHGWALTLDLGGGINVWGSTQRAWMVANAPSFGWVSPSWAQQGAGKEEPWHWEYIGSAA